MKPVQVGRGVLGSHLGGFQLVGFDGWDAQIDEP